MNQIAKSPLATAEFFIELRQPEKAKIVLDLLKPYATGIEQIDQIGKLYADIREFNDTLDLAHKIYNLCKDDETRYTARVNIIRAHLNLNQPKEALEYILINEKLKPNDHPNQMDKAMVYFLLNQKPIGEKILRAILTQPRSKDVDKRVTFNLGTYELSAGNFRPGLRKVMLAGRELNIWESYDLPRENNFTGKIEPGKTILMCSEGGMGDEIISVRFAKHFKDRGMNPIWYTNRTDLAGIFKRAGFETITSLKNYKPDWLWCYAMPSPCYLELEPEDLWYGPYITPLRVKEQLTGNKKVGIKTMGNPKYDQDLHRTIPWEDTINAIPEDYTIYSFHVDEDFHHPRVINLKDKIKSWEDTLDYIDQMDIIVSSCTSLVHAAAAMDKKTYVCTPILNYYTWASPGHYSKWYSENLTVIRQQEYDNWNAPMDELKELLHDLYIR
jgi:hypothetical protein